MTTGNTGMVWKIGPLTGLQCGIWSNRQWSGSDAISPSTPKESYPAVIRNLRDLRVSMDDLGRRLASSQEKKDFLDAEVNQLKAELSKAAKRMLRNGKVVPIRDEAREQAYRRLQVAKSQRKAISIEMNYLRQQKRSTAARYRVEKLRKRALPPNPYWCFFQTEAAPGLIREGGYLTAANYGDYFTHAENIPIPVDRRYKLIGKVRERVYGSGFNPFVFGAEGRKTIAMIGDAARDIALTIRAARRGDVGAILRALRGSADEKRIRNAFSKDAADRHLAIQYGVLPLLKDMEEGAKFIAQAVNGSDPTGQRVCVRSSYFLPEEVSPDQGQIYWWGKRKQLIKHQLIVYLEKVDNAFLPGFYDLASVVWELTPFSFIGDWMFPVQKHLDALRTDRSIKGTWVETVTRHVYYLEPRDRGGLWAVIGKYLPFDPQLYRMYHNRSVTAHAPIPDVRSIIDTRSAKEVLNWRRASNLVALAIQESHRGFR